MIIEYAGPADRSAGPGWIHKARAWWNVHTDDQGEVRRAVLRAVKAAVPEDSTVTFVSWHMDTSTHPTINAWPSVRVLDAESQRLRKVVARACDFCSSPNPCNYLRMPDKSNKAACFTCLRGEQLAAVRYVTVAWIKADGTLQI
jgi:hypothetical protein